MIALTATATYPPPTARAGSRVLSEPSSGSSGGDPASTQVNEGEAKVGVGGRLQEDGRVRRDALIASRHNGQTYRQEVDAVARREGHIGAETGLSVAVGTEAPGRAAGRRWGRGRRSGRGRRG